MNLRVSCDLVLLCMAAMLVANPRVAQAQFSTNPITGTVTSAQSLPNGTTGTISVGGAISIASGNAVPLTMTGTSSLNNNGTIQTTGGGRAIDSNSGTANLTITNTGLISSATQDAFRVNTAGSSVNLTNSGTIQVTNGGQAIDWASIATGTNILTNQATGLISATGEDAVRPGQNGEIINSGSITAIPTGTTTVSGSDGIDLRTQKTVTVTNSGTISGRHGIATDGANAGPSSLTVFNNAGSIAALNGSGINVDGLSTSVTANITNAQGATIKGGVMASTTDADGDGIDVDGILTLDNSGNVFGLGAKGGTNNAEGVAGGGGSIINRATGQITGSTSLADAPNGDSSRAGNGILIDDSNGGNALAATTVENSGLIQGKTGFGIKLIGNFDDTITNQAGGTIQGAGASAGAAIQTGDGNDTVNNAGTIMGENGSAIALQGGNDSLNIQGGSAVITGNIDGGTGVNTMNIALGAGNTFSYGGTLSNIDTNIQSGTFNYTGASSLSGQITVDGGVFKNNGGNLTGTLTLNSGTVSGTNLAGVDLSFGAGQVLSPGNSPGTLLTGSQTWAGGGSYLWEINALATDGGSQGNNPGWDFTDIAGSLTISANSSNQFTIGLDSLGLLSSWNPNQNYLFTLATASGGISGFDPSAFLIDTSAFVDQHALNLGGFDLLQAGNSIQLRFQAQAVPEPSTAFAVFALVGALALRYRRRRG